MTFTQERLCLAGNTVLLPNTARHNSIYETAGLMPADHRPNGERDTVRAGSLNCQNIDLGEITWTPVGPTEDRTAHLRSNLALSQVPMDLHAVEVLTDRDDQVVSKAPELDYMLFAVEVIGGNANRMQRHHINGRSYLVFALPGTAH